MWSLGCILAELFTGCALLPGEDEADQLACMMELLGMPPQIVLENSKRTKNFITTKGYPRYCTVNTTEDGKVVLCGGISRRGKPRGPPGSRDLKKALKGCNDELFLDFLRRCLEWDQHKRITPGEALKHSWFRRRLPKPPGGSSSSTTSNSSSPAATSAIATTTTTGEVVYNHNYPPLSLTSSLHNEFLGSLGGGSGGTTNGNNKMATLPNKLRVQISAAAATDDLALANKSVIAAASGQIGAAATFSRTLHASSSLTSLPQSASSSSSVSNFRPPTNHHIHHHHHHHHTNGGGGGIMSSLLQLQPMQQGTTTKLPQIQQPQQSHQQQQQQQQSQQRT